MVDLSKVEREAPGLVTLAKSAGVSLAKQGVPDGMRAAVYLLLDHSSSMRPYYQDGSVQRLAEQALGLVAHLDDEGVVPTVFFGTKASSVYDVALSDYEGAVERMHSAQPWGSTNLVAGLHAVAARYLATGHGVPGLVIVQTDGSPNSRATALQELIELSRYPLFFAFVGFGPRVGFLKRLDELPSGNTSAFHATDPLRTPDDQLYDGLLHKVPAWLEAAGILP